MKYEKELDHVYGDEVLTSLTTKKYLITKTHQKVGKNLKREIVEIKPESVYSLYEESELNTLMIVKDSILNNLKENDVCLVSRKVGAYLFNIGIQDERIFITGKLHNYKYKIVNI